jgi:hypothetical protein
MATHEFGIHVRRQHRAALEPLSRALAAAVEAGDFHDAGVSRGSTGLANALRKLCCACKEFLANPAMSEHLTENKSTEAGPGTRFLIGAKRTGTQTMDRTVQPARPPSKSEARARFERENQQTWDEIHGTQPGARGANPLAAAMTADLKPTQPVAANSGRAALARSMGVTL